jgi:HK97 family phage portal protein
MPGHILATSRGDRELRAVSGSLEWGPSTVPPPPGGMGGPMEVTLASALQIPAVYSCVSLLSNTVAASPLRLMTSQTLRTAKEIPPSPLITQPYAEMSRLDWIAEFVASLALCGNFFGRIIEWDKLGYAVQIKPIPFSAVKVTRNRATGKIEYRFFGELVPIDQVFHIPMLKLPGMLVGASPIEYLRITFALSMAQTRYGESWFRNSAFPSGVIEVEGDLDEDETIAMLRNWIGAHGGLEKAHLPGVLTGNAKFKPITISPEDSQFLQLRGFSAQEISGLIFRVPPHMVGIIDKTTSWGKGIEQQELGYTLNTVADYTSRLQAGFTALHPPGQYAYVDLSHRTRGDTLERAQSASLMMLAGLAVPDELRGLMFDMPELPDGLGKNLYMPINTELIQQALANITAAQAANNPPPDSSGES